MNRSVKEAKKILEERGLRDALPELEIGQECTLADVWDGEGETPEEDYSYELGEYGDFLEYEFEVIEKDEENPLNSVVKITKIWLG